MYEIQKTKRRLSELTKKGKLLSNPDIKRWYDNVSRGSPTTSEVWLRRLSKFCQDCNLAPMELAELGMRDARAVTDLIQDHITRMEEKGNSPGYIKGMLNSVKSWLRQFDVEIKRKLNVRNPSYTPTLENERVPQGDELIELFRRATLRAGAAMALMAKGGLRPEVLGNYNASDGLMVKDLPDLKIKDGLATFANKPAMVRVRKTLSKARHEYFTFLTDLGAKAILAYLNERIVSGETVLPESPLITPSSEWITYRGANGGKRFVGTKTILEEIRECMRPRFKWRPYVLRAYFDTQLLIAESRGKIAHDFRVFFMGHKGSMESRYTTNKGILPDALITEMKNAFLRSEEFLDLEIETRQTQTENISKIEEIVTSYLTKTQERQKVATPEEVEKLIEEGWQYVGLLPNGKVVVKKQDAPRP
jgi:hypothetical protein